MTRQERIERTIALRSAIRDIARAGVADEPTDRGRALTAALTAINRARAIGEPDSLRGYLDMARSYVEMCRNVMERETTDDRDETMVVQGLFLAVGYLTEVVTHDDWERYWALSDRTRGAV